MLKTEGRKSRVTVPLTSVVEMQLEELQYYTKTKKDKM
jgi:hypothetical protein